MCGLCCGGTPRERRGEFHKNCSAECYNALSAKEMRDYVARAESAEVALADAQVRERWMRERLEDAYLAALGSHTGSGASGLPPILGADTLRAILDHDLSDSAGLETDTHPLLPRLPSTVVATAVRHVFTDHNWSRRDQEPVYHSDHVDARMNGMACAACAGDGQRIGTGAAIFYADFANAIEPSEPVPPGFSMSRLASLIADVVVLHEWDPDAAAENWRRNAVHARHQRDPRCATCTGDVDRIVAAVVAAYVALTGPDPVSETAPPTPAPSA